MRILISAAEASSDMHGAAVLRALRVKAKEKGIGVIEAFGVGGPALEKEGLQLIARAADLRAMGLTEVLFKLRKILKVMDQLMKASQEKKPELALLIDYPDFHFKLAKRLRVLSVPVIDFIPPKVWVWRARRVQTMKKIFSLVLCVFPFEVRFYKKKAMHALYVGNPLVDAVKKTGSRQECRSRLGISEEAKVLALLPGSRASEIYQHVPLFFAAAAELQRKDQSLELWVALPEILNSEERSFIERQAQIARFKVRYGQSYEILSSADAGWVKSGTATLEAALLGCVHAVIYKPHFLTGWLFRNLVRYRGPVGLVNLVIHGQLSECIVPEILCSEVTVPRLIASADLLLQDEEEIQKQKKYFKEVQLALATEVSAADCAAERIIEFYLNQK